MLTMYEAVLCFFIYAILGWCVEVIYATVNSGKFVNRGFLNGPYCPIYGFGVLIVVLCLSPVSGSLIPLFFGSVVLTTMLELVTGFLLERFSTPIGGITPMSTFSWAAISAPNSPCCGALPACL